MGYTSTNRVEIVRKFNPRVIVVVWTDDEVGSQEKAFDFQDADAAFAFAANEFKKLSM